MSIAVMMEASTGLLAIIPNPDAVQIIFATCISWLAFEPAHPHRMYAAMEVGWVARSADGTEVSRPFFLGLLATRYGPEGQAKEGLCVLDEALALVTIKG